MRAAYVDRVGTRCNLPLRYEDQTDLEISLNMETIVQRRYHL